VVKQKIHIGGGSKCGVGLFPTWGENRKGKTDRGFKDTKTEALRFQRRALEIYNNVELKMPKCHERINHRGLKKYAGEKAGDPSSTGRLGIVFGMWVKLDDSSEGAI